MDRSTGLLNELAEGQFWGLLGPNGIGKTILLKCMAGLTMPDAGTVLLENQAIDKLPRRVIARLLGMLQQHTVYVFDASVQETALTGLSGGEARRLAFAALMVQEGACSILKQRTLPARRLNPVVPSDVHTPCQGARHRIPRSPTWEDIPRQSG